MYKRAGHTDWSSTGNSPLFLAVVEEEIFVWTDALEARADAAAESETFLDTGC